jgi:hypothetical protein
LVRDDRESAIDLGRDPGRQRQGFNRRLSDPSRDRRDAADDGPAREGNGRGAHRASEDDRRTTPSEQRSPACCRPEALHPTSQSSAFGSLECPQKVIVVAPDHERALLVADEDPSALGAE